MVDIIDDSILNDYFEYAGFLDFSTINIQNFVEILYKFGFGILIKQLSNVRYYYPTLIIQ